jgi:DNA topoisomerase-6 subunit A
VRYNKRKRFIEMGNSKNRRELFNLSQAKSYMQTMLVSSGCKQLIEQGKTTSIRGMYYLLKHTIEGTKDETFDDQADCDPVIEQVLEDSQLYFDPWKWTASPRRAAPVAPDAQ